MPKHDFIFVDESGDPSFTLDPTDGTLLSSSHYVAAAFHICDDCVPHFNRHLAEFRYYTQLNKELKLPPDREVFRRLLEPIGALVNAGQNVCASVVYLDKLRYTGSYLKPGGKRAVDPVFFRNYILRRLLEFHFKNNNLKSQHYDLVLDRIDMTKDQKDNLQDYLAGNVFIPTPTHITHASSIYVEPLQLVHHIAVGYKDVAAGGSPPSALGFVSARDITTDQYIY